MATCKGVYKVIPNAPFPGIPLEFLQKWNIHVVCLSPEYDKPDDKYYAVPRQLGMTRVLPRTDGISTSDIIKVSARRGARVRTALNLNFSASKCTVRRVNKRFEHLKVVRSTDFRHSCAPQPAQNLPTPRGAPQPAQKRFGPVFPVLPGAIVPPPPSRLLWTPTSAPRAKNCTSCFDATGLLATPCDFFVNERFSALACLSRCEASLASFDTDLLMRC